MPDIDIALTFHSNKKYLKECLDSIFAEKINALVHVIQDGQAESITDLLKQYDECSIHLYASEKNIGPYRLRNLACQHFECDYFAIQDADDINVHNRLSKSLDACKKYNLDLYGCSIQNFSDSNYNEQDRENNIILKPLQLQDAYVYPNAKRDLIFAHPGMIVRNDYFKAIGGYADYFCACDVEFQLRCYWAGANIQCTDEVLVYRRLHSKQLTKDANTNYASDLRKTILHILKDRSKLYPQHKNNLNYFKQLGGIKQCVEKYELKKLF